MLKINVNKNEVSTNAFDSVFDISAEMLLAIRNVYESINESDEKMSEIFKDIMIRHIKLSFMDDEERNDTLDKELLEALEAVLKTLKEG